MTDRAMLENKLAAARTRLILDKPFLGALVLRLPMVAADPNWCLTTATDARKFYYNPEFIEALRPHELQFILAHEALHCALSHFARRQHRLKHRWDIACDYAINPILLEEDLEPPPGILFERSFQGMTAEEIYPCLDDHTDEKDTLDQHIYDDNPDDGTDNQEQSGGAGDNDGDQQSEGGQDQSNEEDQSGPGKDQEQESSQGAGGAPQPPPLNQQEKETLDVQWQQRLAGAAQQAQQAGKLSGGMARLVDHLLQPRLPWRMLLARYMSATARDDYSYTRPSSRRGDPAIYPSLRSAQLNLAVALDVSGSINKKEMHEFISEVDAIKGQLRARITLHACDSQMVEEGPWIVESWEDLELPEKFTGGGGTSFKPVFNWLDSVDLQPDLLIYFTDAQGDFPEQQPGYPVIWLVKGKTPVPWGQRIQLN
ncbi:MAG TPA: hypothetical protein EYH06_07670 [Chromatiales bacterium]|nr:hypothetical protein [Thiotrichales bacterium]HIP68455.1 hypothetical protein [Chromatiales bacterium]